MRLRMAMVFAKDLRRMTAFYRDGAGLELLPGKSTSEWSEFDAGGTTFSLHEIPAHIAKDIAIGDPPEMRSEGAIKLFFQTEDVDAARARLIAHGAVMGEVDEHLGYPSCQGMDPEGNVFTVMATGV